MLKTSKKTFFPNLIVIILIIDMHEEVFKQHSDPLSLYPFGFYGHYTEEGYNLIANTIIKKVYEFEK